MHARRVQVPLFPRLSRLKTDCELMYRSTSQVIVETNMAETAIKRTARADPAPIPGKADTTGRMRDVVSPVAAQEVAATENSLLANDNPASVCGMLAARRQRRRVETSRHLRGEGPMARKKAPNNQGAVWTTKDFATIRRLVKSGATGKA